MFLKAARIISRIVLRLIARVDLQHMDRIPAHGGCLVVSNHIGRMDAMLAMVLSEREDIIMMVAEKYQAYWFWRWVMRRLDAIWLDRYSTDFHALREVYKRLKSGGIATIAPEGTRSLSAELQPGKHGAAYLAAKTGVPIIPTAITGTADQTVYQRLRRLRRLDIRIVVGEPFKLPPMPRQNRDEYLEQSTDEIMCRIAALLPSGYHGAYANHSRLQELLNGRSGWLEKEIGD